MKYVKRTQIIGLIVLALMLSMFVQPASAVTKRGKKKYYKKETPQKHFNSWSFQLALEDEYDDDEFDGVRLSVQKLLSRNSAVKFSIGVLDKVDDPFNNIEFYNDGITFAYNGYQSTTEEVNFSIQYVNFPQYNRSFNVYWSVGPRFSVTEAKFDPDVFVDVPSQLEWVDYADFNSSNRIGLGIEGNVGAELFLGRNFSLLAEYGFIAENRWYVFDVDYYNNSGYRDNQIETFDDGSHLDWSRIRLGFAMHF